MRTIKFRGKASHNGEWLYGDLINIHGEYHILGEDDMREDGHHVTQDSDRPTWVEPDTIGQFTGLLDKNGKEIYEGDIIQFTKGWKRKSKTDEWQKDNQIAEVIYFGAEFNIAQIASCSDVIEVLGNIYDNPELLEGGKHESKRMQMLRVRQAGCGVLAHL